MTESDALVMVVTETALGWAGVALSAKGIRYATLLHVTEAACRGELRAARAREADDPRGEEVAGILRAWAVGEGPGLDAYPVDPTGTPFQVATWLALREIPRGETRSYGWLARRMGDANAARAIGALVGSNPIPLWLPCHRVVAADGSLHGFGGGLAMKRQLLELEGALPQTLLEV